MSVKNRTEKQNIFISSQLRVSVQETSEMKRSEPEPNHSPSSVAKEYGSAKLQLSGSSAYSLEKFAINLHIKTDK